MAKFLVHSSYTRDGVEGIVREGGSSRRAMAEKMIESLGGRVEAFYFAFGPDDVVILVDLPDNVSAAAVALATTLSGSVTSRATVLLTPEEIDRAAAMSVAYRPPGR
jgi:uncharacterized protein with GYD domain